MKNTTFQNNIYNWQYIKRVHVKDNAKFVTIPQKYVEYVEFNCKEFKILYITLIIVIFRIFRYVIHV